MDETVGAAGLSLAKGPSLGAVFDPFCGSGIFSNHQSGE